MYRGADSRRAAAFAAAFASFAKPKLAKQKVEHVPFTKTLRVAPPSMAPPSMAPPSMAPSCCCPDTDGFPCKHIRQAATRGHLECVKHFWGLRTKGNPEEEYFEKQAVLAALRNMHVEILEYLLFRRCPWDPDLANGFFGMRQTSPWNEWRDLYDIAFKYKLFSPCATEDLLQKLMVEGQWDFLEKIHKYGQTFETVDTRGFAVGPDGANIDVLRELHMRKAFRTADLTWLTPHFALAVKDPALLQFAREMQAAAAKAAKA